MKTQILFAIVYLIIDILWITMMSPLFYKRKIESVQMSKPFAFKLTPAILAYATLLVVHFFICIPLSKYYKPKFPEWFVFGLIGFCVYGVYNFTNGAIFTNYDATFIFVDTLWGSVSFALLGIIYAYLYEKLRAK